MFSPIIQKKCTNIKLYAMHKEYMFPTVIHIYYEILMKTNIINRIKETKRSYYAFAHRSDNTRTFDYYYTTFTNH